MVAEFVPFSPYQETDITARNMPHWQQSNRTYFVTFRLADSIPASKLNQYNAEKEAWLRANPGALTNAQIAEYSRRFPERFHNWLDSGAGECLLKNTSISNIVEQALLYFDGKRHVLDGYVVMPNHVHVLVMPLGIYNLSKILHSWKSYTAHEINKRLNRKGTVWQDETYDHIVRSKEQMLFYRSYIMENPIKANLPDSEYRLGSGVGVKV